MLMLSFFSFADWYDIFVKDQIVKDWQTMDWKKKEGGGGGGGG